MKLFDLTGKTAIVTGASSGLGAEAARAYAEAGADIAILARRKNRLDELAESLKKEFGKEVLAVTCDVSNEESAKAAAEAVFSHFGHIDILLNNAGIALPGTVESMSNDQWQNAFNVNIMGIVNMSKYVIPHMTSQNYGKIVNIASVNAIIADKEMALVRHSYNTTKAGVRGLTMAMAATYMQHGITVNSIGPGLFESEMTKDTLFKSDDFMKMYNHISPAGRPGRHGELNGTIIFLSSDASSYVTSQHIIVDGGTSIV